MTSEETYEWVVIGGGPHGVHVVASLVERGLAPTDIALLDRHARPLHVWTERTSKLRMGHLRSSAVHHIAPSPWSLVEFARGRFGHPQNWSAPPYQRPSYDVFQEHCEFVISKYSILESFQQRTVNTIKKSRDGLFDISSDQGPIKGRRVVLSLGQPAPNMPAWALNNQSAQHLLAVDWRTVEGQVTVVGGGMTACQFCLAHCEEFERTTLVAPAWPSLSDFDADPCWIGPKCRTPEFEALASEEKRRRITQARRPGSVNQAVLEELQVAVDKGKIEFCQGRVVGLEGEVLLLDSGQRLATRNLVLATGFEKTRPGGELVNQLIADLELEVAPCGFPVLSESLEWTDRLFVTGGLAELRLGPVSRNITGARSAAKLILENISESRGMREAVLC